MPYSEASFQLDRPLNQQGQTAMAYERNTINEYGVRIERVHIADGCEQMPGRRETQSAVAYMDRQLNEHPDWKAPYYDADAGRVVFDPANEAANVLYRDSQTLQNWVVDAAQAHASALYPLQRPFADTLPSGQAIDNKSRMFFYHGLDAIGIRTRAKIMTDISVEHLKNKPAARWISLACGGAVPVIDALKEHDKMEMIHLDLVDFNPDALTFASSLADGEAELQKVPTYNQESELRSYSTHQINLIRDLIASDNMVDRFGENCSDMVDALGIFEYFSQKDSVKFLKNAYRMVRSDGVMVIANMLSDRPQMEFNRRGVGWPKLYPRSTEELSQIIIDAEIDPEKVKIIIPEDAMYAVVEIRK